MQVVMVVLNIGSVATRNHIEELYHLNFIDLSFLHVDLWFVKHAEHSVWKGSWTSNLLCELKDVKAVIFDVFKVLRFFG